MRLGKSIYGPDGKLLLGIGIELTDYYIQRLLDLGVFMIYVDDPLTRDVELEPVIDEETRQKAVNAVRKALLLASGMLRDRRGVLEASGLIEAVDMIADELTTKRRTLVSVLDLKCYNSYTYEHSVNCCVLGLIVGINRGYDEFKLRNLGLGLLLHDIGKMLVPNEILNKPGTLDPIEFKQVMAHPQNGYRLLTYDDSIPPVARIICLQHHERCDGSGYPRNLAGDSIHEFSKIAAAIDVYDALTSDRVYRRAYRPHQAVAYMRAQSNLRFDHQTVQGLLKHIAPYPIGTTVRLTTGDQAVVIAINERIPDRPTVRLSQDESGRDIESIQDIDLGRELGVDILEVVS